LFAFTLPCPLPPSIHTRKTDEVLSFIASFPRFVKSKGRIPGPALDYFDYLYRLEWKRDEYGGETIGRTIGSSLSFSQRGSRRRARAGVLSVSFIGPIFLTFFSQIDTVSIYVLTFLVGDMPARSEYR